MDQGRKEALSAGARKAINRRPALAQDAERSGKMKNKFAGSSFDSFLREEGISEAVDATALKRAFVIQLEKRMKKVHKNKTAFREALGSPTTKFLGKRVHK